MRITYEEYDIWEEIFDKIFFLPNHFCPNKFEIEQMAKECITDEDFKKLCIFLLWIDRKGISHPKNKQSRKAVRNFLQENIEFMDDETPDQ